MLLPAAVRDKAQARPMARHSSLVTFAELVMIMWGSYLLLMFCYDPEFVGDSHPLTFVVGTCCLAGAVYVFRLMARTSSTGASIRLAIPAVILFWTPVEILGRLDFFREIWIEPARYKAPMSAILTTFIVLALFDGVADGDGFRPVKITLKSFETVGDGVLWLRYAL